MSAVLGFGVACAHVLLEFPKQISKKDALKAALMSGVISGGTAALAGWSLSLAIPAAVAGAAMSVIDTAIDPIFWIGTDVYRGHRHELPYNFFKMATVFAISTATVFPLVGLLGTVYKVGLLGSFLVTWIGNACAWDAQFVPKSSPPVYHLFPEPFLAPLGARVGELVSLARGMI